MINGGGLLLPPIQLVGSDVRLLVTTPDVYRMCCKYAASSTTLSSNCQGRVQLQGFAFSPISSSLTHTIMTTTAGVEKFEGEE